MKAVTILGATGSVGTSTLDIIRRAPDLFRVAAVTAQTNAAKLAEIAIEHRAELAVIGDEACYAELRDRLAGSGIKAAAGVSGLITAAEHPADCVVAAITGAAGLAPTLAAARLGPDWHWRTRNARRSRRHLHGDREGPGNGAGADRPEHSVSSSSSPVPTLVRSTHRTHRLRQFRVGAWAPRAGTGRGITSQVEHGAQDFDRLGNAHEQGAGAIEAYYLFPVEAEQIDVVVHPQSIVHCLVAFQDGSVVAQLSCPDMRIPISVGLAWPERIPSPAARLDLVALQSLTFEAPDLERFPALRLAREALDLGGTAPAILNAANEFAVESYLARRSGFLDIARTVATCLDRAVQAGLIRTPQSLDDVMAADATGRELARDVLAAKVAG